MQKRTADPDFMIRWLNGHLSEAELASHRNRSEYEEMVAPGHAGVTLLPEKNQHRTNPVLPKKEIGNKAKTANSNAFTTFVTIVVVTLLATLFFMKSGGWF